jgi:hypothetical protein
MEQYDMDVELLKLCDDLLMGRFNKMFQENLRTKTRERNGQKYVQIPVTDKWVLIEQTAAYESEACRAMLVQMNFEFEKPRGWTIRLPTSAETIEAMKKRPGWRPALVGRYAASRAGIGWKPHPGWSDWVAGVADIVPGSPEEEIALEVMLNVRPRPLAGLDPSTLCWYSDEALDAEIDAIHAQVKFGTPGPLWTPPKP